MWPEKSVGRIPHQGSSTVPRGKGKLNGCTINHKGKKNHDCDGILNWVGNDNYNTFKQKSGEIQD